MASCKPAGIYFNPLSDMAGAQSLVLPSSIDLLHREAVIRCNAAGRMPAVHAKMLPPSALGLSGFRHSDWHQDATEGMPCCPKSLPCMHYLKLLPVLTISSNLQLRLHGSGMSSSLATVEEPKLLADFGSRLNESASLAEQVAATIAAPSPSHLCISAPVHHCTSTRCISPPPQHTAHNSRTSATPSCANAETHPIPCHSGIQEACYCALLSVVLVGCRNGRLSSWPKCHLRRNHCPRCSDPSASLRINRPGSPRGQC